MPKYIVKYAHEDQTKEDAHGWGTVDIETDLPITTEQQRIEVARTIGLNYHFTKVGILTITEADDDDE